jgi:putative inorganic carbon (HCO3(-)) transporter
MGVLISAAFALVGLVSLGLPWIGVVAAYVVAILNPQTIWWWHFQDVRPALLITLPLLIGTAVAGMRGRLDFGALRDRRIVLLFVLLVCCAVSALWGPYAVSGDEAGVRNASTVLEVQAKILLLLIVGTLCCTHEKAVRALGWSIVVCSAYLIYWANDRYLSLGWVIRLNGPYDLQLNGPYYDENNFAAFFVATMPFIWYLGNTVNRKWIRWALLLFIPFGWHALFLTGSRGGLLGMVAALIFMSLRSGQRKYGFLLVGAFIATFIWQAGDTMKDRAASIESYREDASATSRIEAWGVATAMIFAHPFTGVGPGAFQRAFPTFSDLRPVQAHNTYFQIGGEYGPLGAVALLVAIVSSIRSMRRRARELLGSRPNARRSTLYAVNESALVGTVGLTVCSFFLTLQLFELLYFLIFLAIVTDRCIQAQVAGINSSIASGQSEAQLSVDAAPRAQTTAAIRQAFSRVGR